MNCTETTGVAFSPDGKRMYFAFQEDGYLIEVRRTDGLSFHGRKAQAPHCGIAAQAMNVTGSLFTGFKNLVLP